MNKCTSPYTRYGKVLPMVTSCHCNVRHQSDDLEKDYHTVADSGIIKQTLFSFEEAKREMDEEKYIEQFCKLAASETKTKCLNTKDGKKILWSKVKEIKKGLKKSIKNLKTSLINLKQELNAIESEYKLIKIRCDKFDRDPSAIESHGFSGRKNKERILNKHIDLKKVASQNVKTMEEDIKYKQKQSKNNKNKWKNDGLKVLIDEAMKQTRIRLIDEGRVDAMKNNWRRPWDGEDGNLFKIWMGQKRGSDTSEKKKSRKDDPDGEDGYSSEGDETDDDDETEDDDDDQHSNDNDDEDLLEE